MAGYGTTQETQSYTYKDSAPLNGKTYYRLLQKDFDGQSEYSDVVEVILKGEATWKDQV